MKGEILKMNSNKETINENILMEYRSIYWMCFCLAIFHSLGSMLSLIHIIQPSWIIFLYMRSYILPGVLIIGYICIYQKIKKDLGHYCLCVINIMCLLTGGIPLLGLIVECLGHMLYKGDYAGTNYGFIFSANAFSDIFLFSIFLIMCIYYIKNKSILIFFSFLNLFIYLLLEVCFSKDGLLLPFGIHLQNAQLQYASVYSILVRCLGYLTLGIFMRR